MADGRRALPGRGSRSSRTRHLAGAVFTTLPPKTALLSSDLSINFLAPASPASERLVATGTVIHAGRRQGLSEARIEDAAGRLLAHATSRCVVQPIPFEVPDAPTDMPPPGEPTFETPDPHRRPPEGEVLSQAVWDETGGLDLVQLWAKGELAPAPVCTLLLGLVRRGRRGWRDDLDAGVPVVLYGLRLLLRRRDGSARRRDDVDGGDHDAPARRIVRDARSQAQLPAARHPRRRDLVARATVEQRGRTIAVTTARIDDADGRRVAMATGSAMISPERPWPRDDGA